MESDFTTSTTSDDAAQVLRDLQDDRATLIDRIRPPRWYYAAFATVAAGWVATPAIAEGAGRTTAVAIVGAFFIVLVASYPRLTGTRVNRVGWRTFALLAVALVVTLLLHSVALALAASLSAWWVLAPAVASFLAVLALGYGTERARSRSLGDVR